MFGGELRIDAQALVRRGGIAGGGARDREPAEVVDPVGRAMLEAHVAGRLEQHVDDRPLRGCEHHLLDERLALVAAAVAAHQLHARAADGEVEDARVRRVHEVQAHDLAYRRLTGEAGLTVGQHDVAEAAHRGVGRPGAQERRDASVFHEQVVQGQGDEPVGRRPERGVGGLDHDGAVQAHLLPVVFAHVRVVPVEAGVGELELVGERAADRDGLLRLVRDAVVAVLQPQAVPVRRGLGVSVVPHLDGDLRPLVDVERRTGDRVVVRQHAQLCAVDGLADRMDGEVESIAIVKADDVRARRLMRVPPHRC